MENLNQSFISVTICKKKNYLKIVFENIIIATVYKLDSETPLL